MKRIHLSGCSPLLFSEPVINYRAGSCAVFLAAFALFAMPVSIAIAAGNALFHPASASRQHDVTALQENRLDRIKKEPSTRKARLVLIDLNALRGDSFDITLDSGAVLTYVKSRIETNRPDSFTWYGDLPDKQGSAILVVNKGMVTGSVRNHGALYKIESTGNGLHAFIEIDSRGLPPEHPPQLPHLPQLPASSTDLR